MEADGRGVSQQEQRSATEVNKSAAWHRVSSARQQSKTPGMFQSTSQQTNWQHEMQKKKQRCPRTTTSLNEIWDTVEKDIDQALEEEGGHKNINGLKTET